jgi:hypothetical protein
VNSNGASMLFVVNQFGINESGPSTAALGELPTKSL